MGPLYPRLLLSLLLFAVPLGAAEESGAVFGTVVDSGGYPLPRATIRLSHQAQERQYEVDTDVNGRFHVKDVAPGAYKITIGHQGFQQSITEIRVSAGVETDIGVQQLAFGQCNTPGGPICDVFGLSDSRGAGNAGQASGCQLQIGDSEVFRVAQLPGSPQAAALRGLLTDRKNLSEAVFYYGDRLRPALRVLLQDAQVGERAAGLLAFIAVPADVKAIIGSPPRPEKPAFANRWAYGVATSLLEPTSDEEWTFLRKCALNEFADRWVDAGAIQTLKLIASPRSRAILEEAQRINSNRIRSVTRAMEYLNSEPTQLFGTNLPSLAEHVAETVRVGEWKGNSMARCNEMGDRALVDFTFEVGLDRLIYTATFHRSDATWRLRGVRETMQALILRPTVVLNIPRR